MIELTADLEHSRMVKDIIGKYRLRRRKLYMIGNWIPAPTLAELWARLPDRIEHNGETGFLGASSTINWKRRIGYFYSTGNGMAPIIQFDMDDKNPASAACELLKWVEENK